MSISVLLSPAWKLEAGGYDREEKCGGAIRVELDNDQGITKITEVLDSSDKAIRTTDLVYSIQNRNMSNDVPPDPIPPKKHAVHHARP